MQYHPEQPTINKLSRTCSSNNSTTPQSQEVSVPTLLLNSLTSIQKLRKSSDAGQLSKSVLRFDGTYSIIANYYRSQHNNIETFSRVSDEELTTLLQFTQELSAIYQDTCKYFMALTGFQNEKIHFIYSGIYYLGQCMMHSYDSYAPQHDKIWSDVHKLFSLAEEHNYLPEKVYNCVTHKTQTIAALYTQLNLIAITNPYQMTLGDNWFIYDYLDKWGANSHILPSIKQFATASCFCVDTTSNSPASADNDITFIKQMRIIDPQQLNTTVDSHIEELESGIPASTLTSSPKNTSLATDHILHLLKQCSYKWKKLLHRQEVRTPCQQDRVATWGLQNIHLLLDQSPTDTSFNIMAIVNESQKGVCVKLQGPHPPLLTVGQLLSLSKPNSDKHELGIVRWISSSLNQETHLGVEKIFGEAIAVQIKTTTQQPTVPAILIVETILKNEMPYQASQNKQKLITDSGSIAPLQQNVLLQQPGSNAFGKLSISHTDQYTQLLKEYICSSVSNES